MRTSLLLALLAALPLAAPAPARACGGGFSTTTAAAPTTIGTQRAMLELGSAEITGTFEIRGEGSAEGFVWVLPLPGFTSAEEAPAALFASLDEATRPLVTLEYKQDSGGETDGGCGCLPGSDGSAGGLRNGGGGSVTPVEVVASGTLGPLAYDVIAPGDPAAMESWLVAEGYAVPDDVKPLLQRYGAAGQYFLWAKGRPGARLDDLKPLRIRWPRVAGAPIVYGLELARAGGAADVSVSLWIRTETGRVEAGGPWHNGRLADVAERIRASGGMEYEDAFAATLEELGPPAFVTEAGIIEADGRYLTRLRTTIPRDAVVDVELVETGDSTEIQPDTTAVILTTGDKGGLLANGLFFGLVLLGLGARRRAD